MLENVNYLFPLVLSATGILACIVTSFFATHIMPVSRPDKIESTLKWQLIISSILLTPAIVLLSLYLVPTKLSFSGKIIETNAHVKIMVSALCGLWSGLLIGYCTDYFTSNAHNPCIKLAYSCKAGAAINIIHGLALGYLSCIIPIVSLAGIFSFKVSDYLCIIQTGWNVRNCHCRSWNAFKSFNRPCN